MKCNYYNTINTLSCTACLVRLQFPLTAC